MSSCLCGFRANASERFVQHELVYRYILVRITHGFANFHIIGRLRSPVSRPDMVLVADNSSSYTYHFISYNLTRGPPISWKHIGCVTDTEFPILPIHHIFYFLLSCFLVLVLFFSRNSC
ncbi:hypothetical protein QBC35DRAFT_492176 [Podospora australis]|uniref:Uncharacterized protein n=1 Tax=Podospora australis TaxID=1536484 RepID=A0AAN6WYP5_9PEZI|nr:hypothetical protein QBC35DRAFT_492176 [Podospora australis]